MAIEKPQSAEKTTSTPSEKSERAAVAEKMYSETDRVTLPQQPEKRNPVQGGTIDFQVEDKAANPYGENKGMAPKDGAAEQLVNDLARAQHRAMLGLEQDASEAEVLAKSKGFTKADMVAGLGLQPDATNEQINAALQARMRDNVGLPADASETDYLQRLTEFNQLAATDPEGARQRADLALPPSATDEMVAEADARYRDSYHKALLGLPQDASEAEVSEAFTDFSINGAHPEAFGLPADASVEDIVAAAQAKQRDDLGLEPTATKTELARRLAEYEELAKVDPDGAQMRLALGLAPSATVDEMWDAYAAQTDEEKAAMR